MLKPSLCALALAGLLGVTALPVLADNSTGPTNPVTKGTDPSKVGVPSGTDTGKVNRNTDGSATQSPGGTSTTIDKQDDGKSGGNMDDDDDDDEDDQPN